MDMMRQGWSMSLFQASQQCVEDVVVGFEDAVRQPIVAHELPDILDGIEFRAFGRERDDADVVGETSAVEVPPGFIEDQYGMGVMGDLR